MWTEFPASSSKLEKLEHWCDKEKGNKMVQMKKPQKVWLNRVGVNFLINGA
jgi:hypothetical protein